MVESTFLAVGCGDAILVRFKGADDHHTNILIDGGYVGTYQRILKPQLQKIQDRGEKIDLLILTHYDSDHIGGILSLLRDRDFDHERFIDRCWTNIDVPLGTPSGQISVQQILTLKKLLFQLGKDISYPITSDLDPFILNGARLTVLSPDQPHYLSGLQVIQESKRLISGRTDWKRSIEDLLKEVMQETEQDSSIANGSSIAILLEIGSASFLLMGDAYLYITRNVTPPFQFKVAT